MSRTFSTIPLTALGHQFLRAKVNLLKQHQRWLAERMREAWLNNDARNWSLIRDELALVENRIRELEGAIAEGT